MPLDHAAAMTDSDLIASFAALLQSPLRSEMEALVREGGPVGPFRGQSAALEFLVGRLSIQVRPEEIWLFGSRARGDAKPGSDFDFLLVLPDGLPEEAYSYERAREPVGNCGVAVEVVPVRWSEFSTARQQLGTLSEVAVREGQRVYRSPRIIRLERSGHAPCR